MWEDSLHDVTNNNGNKLVEFAMATTMVVKSTQFQRKDIHKIPWASYDGVIGGRFSNNIVDVKSMRGADSNTGNFLVTSKLNQKLSTTRKI